MLWALLGVLALALAARVLAAAHGIEVRNGSDADMYERLAASLYRDGVYGLPGSANPYDFAPGAPLFAADPALRRARARARRARPARAPASL